MPYKLVALFLLCTVLQLSAQSAKDSLRCQDVVYLKGGSIFRGTITDYNMSDMLTILTWSGTKMTIPARVVRKVVQECKGAKTRGEKVYDFKERGWYHCSRGSLLFGDQNTGISLQHSSGYRFNRFVSVGLGIGLENFGPNSVDPFIVPIYAETRGYLTNRRITPFYALGAGFSAIAREQQVVDFWGRENFEEDWKGGWTAQGSFGYRVGNHFIVSLGIRIQRLRLDWDNSAWGGGYGINIYTKRRVELGVGLLL